MNFEGEMKKQSPDKEKFQLKISRKKLKPINVMSRVATMKNNGNPFPEDDSSDVTPNRRDTNAIMFP